MRLFWLGKTADGLLPVNKQGIQLQIIKGDKDINFGSVYENAVAQERQLTTSRLTITPPRFFSSF